MKQWHCTVGGQKYGPVSEEELRSWAATGRIQPTDYVWSEGMTDWVPASTVEGLFAAGLAAPRAVAAPPVAGYVRPHRGGAILALGIIGLIVCPICGIVAWVMGNGDLREIRAGRMDRTGEGMTQAGRICGMIATILIVVSLVVWVIMLLVIGVFAPRG